MKGVFLIDVAAPTSSAGAASLILLVVIIVILVVPLVVGLVLLLKVVRHRNSAKQTRPVVAIQDFPANERR